MRDDRNTSADSYQVEEVQGAFRVVDATGQITGVYVFFSNLNTTGPHIVKVPDKAQAREVAQSIARVLGQKAVFGAQRKGPAEEAVAPPASISGVRRRSRKIA